MSVTAEEDEDTDTGPVYVGTTYDSGDTDISASLIGGTDYTTYGTEVRGTTGYVILYGSDLTSLYTATTVNCTYCSVSYESQNQINLYYSIPLDTASGTLTNDIDVNVAYGGDAYTNFYVFDPTPDVTSMSFNSWNAGSVYYGFTFYDDTAGFGSNPSVSFSDPYVSFSPSSAGDTSITGTLTVGSGDPGGSVTVTVTADAWGGGTFFQAGRRRRWRRKRNGQCVCGPDRLQRHRYQRGTGSFSIVSTAHFKCACDAIRQRDRDCIERRIVHIVESRCFVHQA